LLAARYKFTTLTATGLASVLNTELLLLLLQCWLFMCEMLVSVSHCAGRAAPSWPVGTVFTFVHYRCATNFISETRKLQIRGILRVTHVKGLFIVTDSTELN